MNIGFFVRHFTERGTEVSIYDYAHYNEAILQNKSYIICFTEKAQFKFQNVARVSYDKFKARFPIIEIEDINDMTNIIKEYNLSFFYTLTYGGGNDIYQFNNKNIWGLCKTIKHCVFETNYNESDFYISISNELNKKYNTELNVIPHIVELPICNTNLRNELHIPEDAIVFGRYGGFFEFNIPFVHDTISNFLDYNKNVYFLFMNTQTFYEHPRIIYLDKTTDVIYKSKFINTCNVMIHARSMGETFGLSVAEFSSKNKPVITCLSGDIEHIKILDDLAIIYRNKEELLDIFNNIEAIINSKQNWNAYAMYSSEYIMSLFTQYIFDKN